MKKLIITAIVICMILPSIYAQVLNLPINFEEIAKGKYEKVKNIFDGDYDAYKNLFKFGFIKGAQNTFLSDSSLSLTSDCRDSGFELNNSIYWANWHGYFGNFPSGGFNCSNTINNNIFTAHNWNPGLRQNPGADLEFLAWGTLQNINCNLPDPCPAAATSTSPFLQPHHQIVTAGNDPILFGAQNSIILNKVHSGNHALRLGNACNNCGIEMIEKRFQVTQSNCIFGFWYALVMGLPINHPSDQVPTFIIQVYDVSGTNVPVTSGINKNDLVTLGNGQNYITATDPLLTAVKHYSPCCPKDTSLLAYKPWNYCQINLISLINKTVSIQFITRDCTPNGHFSYAYLDDFCSLPDSANPTGYLELGTGDTCKNPGTTASVCVNYTLPHSSSAIGTVQMTLVCLQNGVSVNTLQSPVLSSGNQYCFTLNDNNSPNSDFDYTITGHFTLNNVQLPVQIIGVSPQFVPGQNNDFHVPCTLPQAFCPCPDTISVIGNGVQFNGALYPSNSLGNLSLTLNGTGNYTEVRANVLDFQLYAKDDQGNLSPACLQCYNNPQSWGSIVNGTLGNSSNQPLINGSVSLYPGISATAVTFNPHEIVFGNSGVFTVHNKPLFLNLILPGANPIACCHLFADVTLKITFRNTDCVECETFISGTLEITPKNSFQPFKKMEIKKIRQKEGNVNNYGINDEGIKKTVSGGFTTVNNYGINDEGIKKTSVTPEHVPGALITAESWNEVQKVYESSMQGKTDHLGTYHFRNLKKGKYKLTCLLPDSFAVKLQLHYDVKDKTAAAENTAIQFTVEGLTDKGPLTMGSKSVSNPLLFESPDFILNNKDNSLIVTLDFNLPNNYGINDEGIKKEVRSAQAGEPVPNAEVYIEQETGSEPIANVVTDANGEFEISMAGIKNFPETGIFKLTISPSKSFKISHQLQATYKEKVNVPFTAKKGGKYRYILRWVPDASKTQNRGCFAVSGKSDS
jgi:hypothetical protein